LCIASPTAAGSTTLALRSLAKICSSTAKRASVLPAQRALERWGAKESPNQASLPFWQMGLIACFFCRAARHGGSNAIISGLDDLLIGEIYQPTGQSFRRGQNAQIDRHMSNTYITQYPFFDGATFVNLPRSVHDYGAPREQTEIIRGENRSSDRANRQPMMRLITSIQFVEPILVRSSRE
jgi:hypothetical protein